MAHMFVVSEETPVFTDEGKHWFKPSTGEIKTYLASGWTAVVTGTTVDYEFPLTFFIRGVKRTTIEKNGLTKIDAITQRVDTLQFRLYDEAGTILPRKGDEVVVFRKSSVGATPVKWYGGEIETSIPVENAPGSTKFTYLITCVDYGKQLNKKLVIESYASQTENVILTDVTDNYATEFSINNVSNDATLSFIQFNRVPAGQVIKEVARRINRDFYVDYDRDIHLFQMEKNPAPYSLTEVASTTGHYKNLRIGDNKGQIRNRTIVTGGVYLEAYDDKDIRLGDGNATAFKLNYKPRGTITVYTDVGAGYVLRTLGIDHIDTAGKQFLVNVNEGTIRNLDHAVLGATHKLKVNYDREVRVVTQDDDSDSVNDLLEQEVGDGVHEHTVDDKTIDTIDGGHDRGQAENKEYSNPMVNGSFWTDQDGYRSGQILTVNMPLRGYANKQYLIQKVTTKIRMDGTTFEYIIVFATRFKGLTEFLIETRELGLKKVAQTEETLHDLINLPKEIVTLDEATPTATLRDVVGTPYTYGADADAGVYGEAEYA